MCGITGFLAPPGTTADRAVLARMVESLTHRGPDGAGSAFPQGQGERICQTGG